MDPPVAIHAHHAELPMLPAVLMQSIMHSLRPKEILIVARCSKWNRWCADSPFAWRDCPPLRLRFHQNLLVPPSPARVSRWLPIALTPDPRRDGVLSEADADLLLRLLDSRPRVVQLGWWQWELPVERGLELLAHPAMQSLSDLGLTTSMRAEWLPAVALLPCLTHLDLLESALSPVEMQPLVHARALRSLFVSEEHGECLSVVMQLTQLTMLCVFMPQINGDNFAAFCVAMSGLEELWLQSWTHERVRSVSPADLRTGFSSLFALRTLRLANTFDDETLAPVLHHVPSLRSLSFSRFENEHGPMLVAQLQRAAPLLQVHVNAPSDQVKLESATKALRMSQKD